MFSKGPNFGSALPIFGSQVSVAALQEYSNVLAPAVLEPRGTGGGRGRAKSISKEVFIFFKSSPREELQFRTPEIWSRNAAAPAHPCAKSGVGGAGGTTPSAFPENIGGKGVEARERHGGGGAGAKERDSGESLRNLPV